MDGKIFFIVVGIIIMFYLTTQVESFYGHYGRYGGYGGGHGYVPGYYNQSPYYRGWCPWWNRSCRRMRNWGPGGRYWW